MPKRKAHIKVESYGRYSHWERGSRKLPKILEFTHSIDAIEGNEFGMILKITGGKGMRLDYCIKHPDFKDSKGNTEPDFIGEYYVSSNNYEFFLGDCIWLPLEDKVGSWEVIVSHEGDILESQKFDISFPD